MLTIRYYADDTQVAVTGPRSSLRELRLAVETVLDTLGTWFSQHGMLVNAKKTEFLLCGDRRQLACVTNPPNIQFLGQTLPLSASVTNLGLVMDPALSWHLHISAITKRCFGILIGLMHIRHMVPSHILPKLVDTLVISHVRYCMPVYGSANRTGLARIQRILNFAARVVSGRRRFDHVSDVVSELGWLRAGDMVSYFDVCLLHSILTGGKPDVLRSWLVFNHEHVCRPTRQSNQLTLPRARNNHGKRRFIYRAADLYNRMVIANDQSNLSRRCLKTSVRQRLTDQ